jgi:5-methylcytosine-specific restriction endonuclease McrA
MKYSEYLKTEKWQFTRGLILNFWNHRCAICNSKENVQVHHRTYDRLGEELTTDCIVLCDRCHQLHHNFTGNFLSGVYEELQV